jgi:hypothetical protein
MDYLNKLIDTIQNAIDKFNSDIPAAQQAMLDEVYQLMKELDVKQGSVAASVKNLRIISDIRKKLEKAILNDDYTSQIQDFVDTFSTISNLQSDYFASIKSEFAAGKFLAEIQSQSIDLALESLTESGIHTNVSSKIQEILMQNVTSGAKYSDMVEQMRKFIVGSDNVPGILERYTKQITTDSLNQYAATYTKVVTDDLGLDWFMYTGALIKTSRIFCRALVAKKYVHKSEIPNIIKGDFEEFRELKGKIDDNTGLPQGMIDGTNESNFQIRRGGYNCGHQFAPVPAAVVPKNLRMAIEAKIGKAA